MAYGVRHGLIFVLIGNIIFNLQYTGFRDGVFYRLREDNTRHKKRRVLAGQRRRKLILFLMNHYDESEPINIGWGKDQTIRELGETISDVVGYQGSIYWDSDKPDGTPRKLLDVSRLTEKGWQAKISLEEGIREVYRWYLG